MGWTRALASTAKLFLRTRVELAAKLVAIGAARSRPPSAAIGTLGRLFASMKRVSSTSPRSRPTEKTGATMAAGGDDDDDGELQGRTEPRNAVR